MKVLGPGGSMGDGAAGRPERRRATGGMSLCLAASSRRSGPMLAPLPPCCLQLNIAFPSTGCQKKLEIEDDAKL